MTAADRLRLPFTGESSLTEPDDVVICSLNPSNDYRTSVLSGLAYIS